MHLRVDTTNTIPAKTLAHARITKAGITPTQTKKLLNALSGHPNSKLVQSNYCRASIDGFPPLNEWTDHTEAKKVIRSHTRKRGADKSTRAFNPKSLETLKPWTPTTRPTPPKTAPWNKLPKVQELRLEGWTWKAIGQEVGEKASSCRYMHDGMSKQIQEKQHK